MTIPIIPGPWSFLASAGKALGTFGEERTEQRRHDQAVAAQNFSQIAQLVQLGMLAPEALATPQMQQLAQTAGLGKIDTSTVVPNPTVERNRKVAPMVKNADPKTVEGQMLLEIPTIGQVTLDQLTAGLNAVKQEAMKNPAVARALAGVLPAGVAEDQERAMSAAAAETAYVSAAERFVFAAKGDAKAAFEQAKADPQYAELVSSGQLSEEYFAAAAERYRKMDEQSRLEWAKIAARRDEFLIQQRQMYTAQINAIEGEIKQRQAAVNTLRKNVTNATAIFAQTGREKQAKGIPLNGLEQQALETMQNIETQEAMIESLQRDLQAHRVAFQRDFVPNFAPQGGAEQTERLELGGMATMRSRSRSSAAGGQSAGTRTSSSVSVRTPTAPQAAPAPAAPAAPQAVDTKKVNAVKQALKDKKITAADVRASRMLTDAEKEAALKP